MIVLRVCWMRTALSYRLGCDDGSSLQGVRWLCQFVVSRYMEILQQLSQAARVTASNVNSGVVTTTTSDRAEGTIAISLPIGHHIDLRSEGGLQQDREQPVRARD